MFALSPWSLARRAAAARRGVLLFVVAAVLFGFGLHAARACVHPGGTPAQVGVADEPDPCHGAVDLAQAACEAHCRTDAQPGRLTSGFDLPPAAPLDIVAVLVPVAPPTTPAFVAAPPRRDTGPPLHLLLHRLLR